MGTPEPTREATSIMAWESGVTSWARDQCLDQTKQLMSFMQLPTATVGIVSKRSLHGRELYSHHCTTHLNIACTRQAA